MSILRTDLLRGTLDLLVLKTLAAGPMHGWGIAHRIQALSGEVFEVQQGSIYPALMRLKRKGWVSAAWQMSENNRRARYYTLTSAGLKQLGEEEQQWEAASNAVNRVLRLAGGSL